MDLPKALDAEAAAEAAFPAAAEAATIAIFFTCLRAVLPLAARRPAFRVRLAGIYIYNKQKNIIQRDYIELYFLLNTKY